MPSERWFYQGVAAFQRARPGAPAVYPCLLCVRGFSTAKELTREDVPPKSVGGRPLVLTCKECNNRAGRLLDSHVRSGQDLGELIEGKREVPIKLTQFGYTVNAMATFSPGAISIAGRRKHTNPRTQKAWSDELERVASSGSTDWDFTISMSLRLSPQRESVGWLRVAYLYAFAALGYQWIMRPELEPIREQFRRPDEHIVPGLIGHAKETLASDGISFVYTPPELRSILVRLGRRLIFLPNFNEASDFYERFATQSRSSAKMRLEGVHIDLPKKPVFLFDEDPKLMMLTVPPATGKKLGGG